MDHADLRARPIGGRARAGASTPVRMATSTLRSAAAAALPLHGLLSWRPLKHLHQSSKVSALVDRPTSAQHLHILVMLSTSLVILVRLHRSLEERARDGRALFIVGVALCASQTREGVCSIAHGPTHPVDGSRPRNRDRRIFTNGEIGGPSAGLPTHLHAHARV